MTARDDLLRLVGLAPNNAWGAEIRRLTDDAIAEAAAAERERFRRCAIDEIDDMARVGDGVRELALLTGARNRIRALDPDRSARSRGDHHSNAEKKGDI